MKLATAATATARPTLPLTGLAAELREAQQRLDVLDAGDPAANVEVSIPATASLDGLAPAHAESRSGCSPVPTCSPSTFPAGTRSTTCSVLTPPNRLGRPTPGNIQIAGNATFC